MTTHVDLDEVRDYHDSVAAILDKVVSNALAYTSNLPGLMSRAFELAACERSLGMFDRMSGSLRTGVEAGLAVFAAAASPNEPVTYTLAGQTVTQRGLVGHDSAHIGRWETVFYGASVLGDPEAIRALCSVPESLPSRSPTVGDSYLGLWFQVLHGLGKSGAIDGELLVRTLEATDPDRLGEDVRDAVLYLRVPALEVLYRIALDDGDALTASLRSAIDKHRSYWTLSASNRRNPTGYVSWPLSALAAVARGRGLAVELESDYLVRLAASS